MPITIRVLCLRVSGEKCEMELTIPRGTTLIRVFSKAVDAYPAIRGRKVRLFLNGKRMTQVDRDLPLRGDAILALIEKPPEEDGPESAPETWEVD